jgi:hypothetical protein
MKFPDITPRAARAISRLMDSLPAEERGQLIPIICWMVADSSEPGFVPRPTIGMDKATIIPPEYVVEASGIKIAFNLSSEILEEHSDCVLDYVGDRLMFVNKNMTNFLGSGADN